MNFAIQGVATVFGKCFQHGDSILYLSPGCFDGSADVKLLYDHDHDDEVFPHRNVEIYCGEKAMAFRLVIPERGDNEAVMAHVSDDLDSYVGVSIGYKNAVVETMTFDGVKVSCVKSATLQEVTLLSKGPPAVDSTYGRVVDVESCGDLEADHERMQLVGRYVNVHRAAKAQENGGVTEHRHSSSTYDRTFENFRRKMQNLLEAE